MLSYERYLNTFTRSVLLCYHTAGVVTVCLNATQ